MAKIGSDSWHQILGAWSPNVKVSNWAIGWIVLKDLSFSLLNYVNWDREETAKIGHYIPFFDARMHHHEQKCAHMHALDYPWSVWIGFSVTNTFLELLSEQEGEKSCFH